ncbi:hypothetical protein RvY_04693 [Ramazzottius varieornatus]|uniref:Transmembrane protein n=1 Tax=Ramazzottius varieornatus TaxID=947166 RepID=A0A1D1UVT3_RAMVA|nr:hypothetical protein RvY_04693 [Ramazzottius varieornatus]
MALLEVATRFRINTTSDRPVVNVPPTAPRFWLPCFYLHGCIALVWLVVFQGYETDPEVFLTVDEGNSSLTQTPSGIPTLFPADTSQCHTTECVWFNLWMGFRWTLWILSIETALFEGWKVRHIFQEVQQATYWGPSLGLYGLYYSKLTVALLSLVWVPNSCFGMVFFWSRGFRGRRIGIEAGFFLTYLLLVAVILVVSTKRKCAKLVVSAVEILQHRPNIASVEKEQEEEGSSGGRTNYRKMGREARKSRIASIV